MSLILASASPRRQELLKIITEDFIVIPPDIEENIYDFTDPSKQAQSLAKQKAEYISFLHKGNIILGADTVVCCDNTIFGKPKNKDDALYMLERISGTTHEVYTGVCLINENATHIFTEKTEVTFLGLTKRQIEWYIDTNEPMDKAGAYGIQGKGALLIDRINGDYYNVMGLPLAKLYQLFLKEGIINE
jgi:MAF protein